MAIHLACVHIRCWRFTHTHVVIAPALAHTHTHTHTHTHVYTDTHAHTHTHRSVAARVVGEKRVATAELAMTSEDFAFMAQVRADG